jgi:hypothetical protein
MRHSNRFLSTVLALSVIGALALGPVSQAGEPKKATRSPAAAKHHPVADLKAQPGVKRARDPVPTDSVAYNFEKLDVAFNPKEFGLDKQVPAP